MKLDKQTEEKVKAEAIKHLEKGRSGFDTEHTIAAVHYIKKIIKKEGGDERILVTAMYLHDIGYPEMKKGYTLDDVIKFKDVHALKGAEEAEKIVKSLGYSENEIKEIVHLVKNHDKVDKIDSHNLQLVMEADSLGQIDWMVSQKAYSKRDMAFLEHFKKKRIPRFKTETGKKFLKELMQKAEHYFD